MRNPIADTVGRLLWLTGARRLSHQRGELLAHLLNRQRDQCPAARSPGRVVARLRDRPVRARSTLG